MAALRPDIEREGSFTFSKFYNFAITVFFAIFTNFAKSFRNFGGVDKIYPHTKLGVNISIQ